MNAAGESERLPHSIGGLIGFALAAAAAYAPLFLVLSAGVMAAYTVAEYAVPAAGATTPLGVFKLYVLQYTGIFADALVVAAVALGVAARAVGTQIPGKTLAGGAVERWLPVIVVTFLAQTIVLVTGEFSGLTPPPEPRLLVVLTAPVIWILWGVLGLTGPFVALDPSRAGLSVLIGFARAFAVSFRRDNLLRLVVLAVITVLPSVLQAVLLAVLLRQHVPRVFFWANAPIDALTIAPITAIQTAFALDFVRRAGSFERPPP